MSEVVKKEGRGSWSNRMTFILAAIGSAVGLGNAWRFPGLAAKHGGGVFILVYVIAMFAFGIPLLMMEISIGRKMRAGAPSALRGVNKKFEPIGWAATTNAFFISSYYAVVFAWVILMTLCSFKFAGITSVEQAKGLWSELIMASINLEEIEFSLHGFDRISTLVFVCLIIAWALIYYCIRNGAHSVGKVVKYTVFLPVVCLLIMAGKGVFMPGAIEGIKKMFIPDFSALSNPQLWTDAFGQVFYSLSIMMAIMFAYGSFLDDKSNIAVDSIIISLSDLAISLLAGVVMFTTMAGTGKLDMMSPSGIATAFIFYPQAIASLTNVGWINAIFAFVFYFCLCTLAIDSAFSIIEGVATAISDKYKTGKKKTTIICCVLSMCISFIFITGAGPALLDIVDNWCNNYNMIIIGILESVAIGWCFKLSKVLDEVNRNTQKFKMPGWWFKISIKFIAPIALTIMVIWNFVALIKGGGVYGKYYNLTSNLICGWLMTAIVFASGFVVMIIDKKLKQKGVEQKEITWDNVDSIVEEDKKIEEN